MTAQMQSAGLQPGASRDRFPGWSLNTDTFENTLAQPPALPPLIALHIGAEELTWRVSQ